MSDQSNGMPKAYNSRDHLVKIKTRNGEADYYPAAFSTNVLGQTVSDELLTGRLLVKLNFVISQEYQRRHTPKMKARP